jgi:4-amino-4-deoxy-L-arabinose transferase-like glycosyltransferase
VTSFRLPESAKRPRTLLLALVALFLATRLLTVQSFPIFSDETLYLDYAQLINHDWAKHKFVSMNGYHGDWKPPLQYWLAAPVIDLGPDPLLAARTVAFLFSLVGLFGCYAFTKKLFGEPEGLVAAALWVLCPTVLFHNNQFTAETFLMSTASLLYFAVLKACEPRRVRWLWAAVAVVLGALLLLFKQSGFLLLALAIILPLARFGKGTSKWKELALNVGVAAAVIVAARLLSNAVLPAAFDQTKERFNAKWVLTPAELLALPVQTWGANLDIVCDYVGAYYGWGVPLLLLIGLWLALRKRDLPALALLAMFTVGAGAICFLLRGFNEYMFNTAIVAVLLPLLARVAVLATDLPRSVARHALLAIALFTVGFWLYQFGLIATSAGRYIERSTAWANTNYLKSWATGFGVDEILTMLEAEKERGIVFTDSQWGNPSTAIVVYSRKQRFPNLRILPITREFLDGAETRKLRDDARQMAPTRLVIFSADASGIRAEWQANVEREMCTSRTEVVGYPGQTPLIVCRF